MLDANDTLGAPGAAGLPSMDAMLHELVRNNPNLAWMPQMLAAQRQTVAEPDPLALRVEALEQELEQRGARQAKLERIARRLSDDLRAARELIADLAAAFGACGLCWGEDPHCPSCRGRGRPGRFAPDPDLRIRFLAEPPEPPAASRPSTHPDHSQRS
jgi:hypothetical protein